MTAPAPAVQGADRAYRENGVPARHASLMASASRLRVRKRDLPLDRILLAAASILTPLGVVFILLAWYGAAHTPKLYEQIDYLISGGLLGATLTVLGGLLYFGYWLTRQLQESRRESAQALQAYRRLEDAMLGLQLDGRRPAGNGNGNGTAARYSGGAAPADELDAGVVDDGELEAGGRPRASGRPAARDGRGGGGRSDGPGATARARTGPVQRGTGRRGNRPGPGPDQGNDDPTRPTPLLLATPRGNLLHRADCPIVGRRSETRPVAAGTEGYGYCRMCDAAGVLT